jgi:hypothetical protein
VELTGWCPSFPSNPWQSWVGPHQRSRKSTCKTEDVASRLEGNAKHACLWVTDAERMLHDTLASVDRNIMHPLGVSLKESKGKLGCAPLAPFEFPSFLLSLFL